MEPALKRKKAGKIKHASYQYKRKTLYIMNPKNNDYHTQQNIDHIEKMREVLETLPPFCKQFFRGVSEYTSARTRLAYAYDLKVFFEFLHKNNAYCRKMEIPE